MEERTRFEEELLLRRERARRRRRCCCFGQHARVGGVRGGGAALSACVGRERAETQAFDAAHIEATTTAAAARGALVRVGGEESGGVFFVGGEKELFSLALALTLLLVFLLRRGGFHF